MKIINRISEVNLASRSIRMKGKKVGLVPTMGNLHEGHLSLVDLAKKHSDEIFASIFVNPMQFGPNEDFDSYPRTFERDCEVFEKRGVDVLFAPTLDEIYPNGKERHTQVLVDEMLTKKLCGLSRPTHFSGVTTVVSKLFNIIQPDIAVFGKKDYQQLAVIKKMVRDLNIPISIYGGEIIRETNGLAMSSRNGYLTAQQKQQARFLRETILQTAEQLQSTQCHFNELENQAKTALSAKGFTVDYFTICTQDNLSTPTKEDTNLLIAAAAWLGQPRLIDNLEVFIKS